MYSTLPASAPRSMPLFQHEDLDSSTNQIRLLQINSVGPGNQIQLSLTEWKLDEAPSYAALSYTWGDAKTLCEVFIGSSRLCVTKNCAYALWQLHHHDPNGYYWIDAICINQTKRDERNHQVNMVGQIYKQADSVMVALGPHTSGTEYLFRILSSVKAGLEPEFGSVIDYLDDESLSSLYRSMLEITHNDYWSRVWILQEYVLAKQRSIMRGDSVVSSTTLNAFLDSLINYRRYIGGPSGIKFLKRSQELSTSPMRNISSISQRTVFEDLLKVVRTKTCSDPRDRIYGILSIAEWRKGLPALQADYSSTRVQVAVEALAHVHIRDMSWTTAANDISDLAATRDLRLILDVLCIDANDPGFVELVRRRHQNPATIMSMPTSSYRKCNFGPIANLSKVDCFASLDHLQTQGSVEFDSLMPMDTTLCIGDVLVGGIFDGVVLALRPTPCYEYEFLGLVDLDTTDARFGKTSEMANTGRWLQAYLHHEDILLWFYMQQDRVLLLRTMSELEPRQICKGQFFNRLAKRGSFKLPRENVGSKT